MYTKRVVFISVLASLYSSSLFATPEFAREQGVSCTVCHTNIPMLNDTGQSFLRNGFRFSSDDSTTVENVLNKKHVPLAVMIKENYSSEQDKWNTKVKIYAGGSLTKNISFFAVTQKSYNDQDKSNAPDYFDEKGSRAYFQMNFNENKHVLRVGLLSPFTQFGNISRSSADSGLKGGNSNQNSDQEKNSGGGKNRAKGDGNSGNTLQGGNQDKSSGNGNQKYKTPLQSSSFSKYKGLEYSYLYNDKLLFLFSYGEPVDNSNQNESKGSGINSNQAHNNQQDSSMKINTVDNPYQFISGLRYYFDSGYKIGLMYNKFETKSGDSFSLVLPIEKQFSKFLLNTTLIYKDNEYQDNYYGMENILTYGINDNSYVRAIFNMDKDENSDNNYGYSLSYSNIYRSMFLFHISAVKKETTSIEDDSIHMSISMMF